MDESLQQEARALGDPTRHRVFRYIADADRPVGVAELTDHVQLNHNAVRQHLAVLKEANLVVEEIEDRSRPGRPRLLYRLHPEVADRWGTPGSYAWLASLLASAVRHHETPREAGIRAGHERVATMTATATGTTTSSSTISSTEDVLQEEMARRGFRPTRVEKGRRLELVLERCPFAEVAGTDPATICALHLGLAEGLAEGLGGLVVERLVRKRPDRAGCRLVLRRDDRTRPPA